MLGVGLLGLLAITALNSGKPTTPLGVLEEALSLDETLQAFNLFESRYPRVDDERLRGLSEDEARDILAACRRPETWTVAGEEERGPDDCDRYFLASCETEAGTLVARLWMDRGKVDHLADLAINSGFLACRTGQCPDFAVGEPRPGGSDSCGTRFKVNGRVSKP